MEEEKVLWGGWDHVHQKSDSDFSLSLVTLCRNQQ